LNTAAIAAGFFICYGSTKIGSSLSWRLPFAINALASLLLAVLAPMCPYSPRWLMSKGRRDEAAAVLEWLAGDANEAEKRELLAVPPRVESKRAAFLDIWKKDVRGRTTLGVMLNGFTQLSGM
jgi:MFS family permease